MEPTLQETISFLSSFPASLEALLRNLPEAWLAANEGERTFDALQVVGHLIYAEHADWMPRVRTILESGDTRPFDAFDRWGFENDMQGKSLSQLLDEFARAREKSISELRSLNLQPADLERRGRHPAIGTVTLSQLLATWATHDLSHLHQISRTLANQYRQAVGPWAGHLGVLQCAGHSS